MERRYLSCTNVKIPDAQPYSSPVVKPVLVDLGEYKADSGVILSLLV